MSIFDFIIACSYFKKRGEHLIICMRVEVIGVKQTFSYFKNMALAYKASKVIPKESLTTQYNIRVLDVWVQKKKEKDSNFMFLKCKGEA